MADMRGFKVATPNQAGDSTWAPIHVDTYGNLFQLPSILGFGVAGRVFAATFGTVTTPLGTPATQVLRAASPQAYVRVPDGTAAVPLSAKIVVESQGGTTQGEVSFVIAQNDVGNGSTSAAATVSATSLNTAVPVSSNCVARQLDTDASATAPTNPLELKRFSFAASAVDQVRGWNADTDGLYLPIVRGPGTFGFWIGGNAVQFFATLVWLEVPETALAN